LLSFIVRRYKVIREHDALVRRMQTEMEAVVKPVVRMSQPTEAAEEDDDEETADK
jgi:hypothetical protein